MDITEYCKSWFQREMLRSFFFSGYIERKKRMTKQNEKKVTSFAMNALRKKSSVDVINKTVT